MLGQNAPALEPVIAWNLAKSGIEDARLSNAVDHRMTTWARNHILFHEAGAALSALHAAELPTAILKGAALARLCYDDPGLRPMNDVDVLVPESKAARAIDALQSAGWSADFPNPHALVAFNHSVGFTNVSGGRCDLHWRVLDVGRQDVSGEDWWLTASAFELAGVTTSTLSPADHLLHVCVHGAKWQDKPPLRWVIDAAVIVRRWPDLDWSRLVTHARQLRLTLAMADTLAWVAELLPREIPLSVVRDLRSSPATAAERRHYRFSTGSRQTLRGIARIAYWHDRWKLARRQTGRGRSKMFAAYLQAVLGTASPWQLPLAAAARLSRAMASDVRG